MTWVVGVVSPDSENVTVKGDCSRHTKNTKTNHRAQQRKIEILTAGAWLHASITTAESPAETTISVAVLTQMLAVDLHMKKHARHQQAGKPKEKRTSMRCRQKL